MASLTCSTSAVNGRVSNGRAAPRVQRQSAVRVAAPVRGNSSSVRLASSFVAPRVSIERRACAARVTMGGDGLKRVIISGAPASGKGTQCEKIVEEFGLAHISAGDLLRAEVKAGTEAGKLAEGFMKAGALVPDEVVITMVKNRLAEEDAQTKGWLLDGYPRSGSQADALKEADIVPDLFLLLEVPDEVLIERVVGRRMDPETGKIYHMTFFPPPEDIVDRLVQRSDDNEEAAVARLATHAKNVNAVVDNYKSIMVELDGNRSKDDVFADIQAKISAI